MASKKRALKDITGDVSNSEALEVGPAALRRAKTFGAGAPREGQVRTRSKPATHSSVSLPYPLHLSYVTLAAGGGY